jgi:demethoxyubiquinone hydroxylase (CLK1/Coq7/Cat5 family)
MERGEEKGQNIIRPEMDMEDFSFRGDRMSLERRRKIKKGLQTLHTLELMAQNIYKFQITRENTDLNRHLITAMCNEMSHYQDFQVKLYEFGWRPSIFRWMFWIVGFCFGLFSKILGRKMTLRTGIWVETLAVKHYGELLKDIDWDDDTRAVVERNWNNEKGHVSRWKSLLSSP